MAPKEDVFDAGLGGGSDRHRVAVAAQSGRDPEDVHLLDGGCSLAFFVRREHSFPP